MKMKLLSLAVAVLIFSTAHSQSFHLGIKGGANINKLSGQSFSDKFSYGYHLGGFAEIGLGNKWAIQPEVLFNQIKTDTSSQFRDIYTSLSASNASKIKLSYLSIPILLDYKLSKFFTLQAGPQFGVLIDQNKNLLDNGKDAFKKGDFSMLGGVQLQVASFRIYGRYALGLSNLNDIDNKDKWRSQSFQVGVGFAIL
jgi:hypothetical protein